MNFREACVIWYRSYYVFKKNLFNSTLFLLMEPILSMLAFGIGVGALVGKVRGMSYLEFFFVGRMANTALITTFFKATNGFFNKIHIDGVYANASIAHIQPESMFWGELFWISCRTMYAIVVAWFLFCLFDLGTWSAIAIAPILFINVVTVAALGMALTVCVESSHAFFFSSIGFMIPLSLFSGAFFPVENLPKVLYYVALLFPQATTIELSRSMLSKMPMGIVEYLQIFVLLIYLVVSIFFSHRLFVKNVVR